EQHSTQRNPQAAMRSFLGQRPHSARCSADLAATGVAPFEVLQHLIDQAHRICSNSHAPTAAASASVGTTLTHQAGSRRADGVSAAARRTSRTPTSWPPPPYPTSRDLCARMLTRRGTPRVAR